MSLSPLLVLTQGWHSIAVQEAPLQTVEIAIQVDGALELQNSDRLMRGSARQVCFDTTHIQLHLHDSPRQSLSIDGQLTQQLTPHLCVVLSDT